MLETHGPSNFSNVYGDYFVQGRAFGQQLDFVYDAKVYTAAAKPDVADLLKETF